MFFSSQVISMNGLRRRVGSLCGNNFVRMLVMVLFILFVEECECVLVSLFKIFARFFLVPAGKTVHQSSCEANQEVSSTSLLDVTVDVFNDFGVGGVGCDLNHERILPWISGQGNRKEKSQAPTTRAWLSTTTVQTISSHMSLLLHDHSSQLYLRSQADEATLSNKLHSLQTLERSGQLSLDCLRWKGLHHS